MAVTSWNVHSGVDGWTRPFPVVDSCLRLDSDVLVLQECWTPADGPGLAEQVAAAGDYHRVEVVMGSGRMGGAAQPPGEEWGPVATTSPEACSVFIDHPRPLARALARADRYRSGSPGTVSHAVLTRLPVVFEAIVGLGRLRRDRVSRSAIVVEVSVGETPLRIVGTHMSHLTVGSPMQLDRLRRELRSVGATTGTLVAGDMNLWGPPLRALLRDGRRRAVRGPTWPAWRPHSQIDHVLVTPDLRVEASEASGSDHRPVRVHVSLDANATETPRRA